MIGGITHGATQTCDRCDQLFAWSPGVGLCPYCDLSDRARSAPYGRGVPCPSTCCTEGVLT